jgi:hypothetical protein
MEIRTYKAWCRLKDEPGAGTCWVYIQAANPIQAIEMLRAQYGNLLISSSCIPA